MIRFTIDELNTILAALDAATKAGGLAAAEKFIPIVGKMRMMAVELSAPPAPPDDGDNSGAA